MIRLRRIYMSRASANCSVRIFIFLNIISLPMFGQLLSVELPDVCFIERNEKVYVHLDKSVYVSGEQLNYKAYVVNASSLKPFTFSKIIYFELVDFQNQPVLYWRANLTDNMASGFMELPDTLTAGIYTVRAFTNWMRNNYPYGIFNTQIVVAGIGMNAPGQLSLLVDRVKASVFPEGGNLVSSLSNKVGFKVFDSMSDSRMVEGKVIEDNVVIDTFEISSTSAGSFQLTPEFGKKYMVEFNHGNGQKQFVTLPDVKKSGYVLSYNGIRNGCLYFSVNTNMHHFIDLKTLRLLLLAKGNLVLDKDIPINDGNGELAIEIQDVPEGIIQVVLLSPDNQPVCERLIYVEPDDLNIQITTQKDNFTTREKVKVEVFIENLSKDEKANFSISVTEENPFTFFNNQGIKDYYNYYSEISNNNVLPSGITEPAKNNWLLATNPSDYIWNPKHEIACNYLLENKGFVLNGGLLSKINNQPISGARVLLAVPGNTSLLDYCTTDTSGRFYFLLPKMMDNKQLVLQLENISEIAGDILWEFDSKNGYSFSHQSQMMTLTDEMRQYLTYSRKVALTACVFDDDISQVRDDSIFNDKRNISRSFYGAPNYIIYPSDFLELDNFQEISDNLLPAVKYKKKKTGYSLQLYDPETSILWEDEGLIILNGVPFINLSYIAILGSKAIERIEVCQSRILYGDLSFSGIVAIYTHDKKIPDSYLQGMTTTFQNEVHTQSMINPEIEVGRYEKLPSYIPDFRRVLYWNPDIQTMGKQKVTIEFYTSDLKSTYTLNIQGITETGKPFNVTKPIYIKE